MRLLISLIRSIAFAVFLICCSYAMHAQASWEKFGQNRVQYRTFQWKYYDSTHFRAFYYDYGKANALYALNLAELELTHIVYMMGGKLNKKLNLILYNTFGDYRQTNLGRKNDELNAANGGKLDVAGDYIALYFDGDHQHLKNQIRSGIARVIKDNMLFGDNIKDVVKNAVKMNLPEWYTLGYVSFIAAPWSGQQQAEIEHALQLSPKKRFADLAQQNPTLFGHSFWHFVADRYGENNISNLLYLTRYRMTIQNAIEMVFKKPANELYAEWASYYAQSSQLVTDKNDSLAGRIPFTSIKTKNEAVYSQVVPSPTGREIAYVEKRNGQFRIYIQDVKYNKTYLIIEGGIRGIEELADPDYPMLCWSASGNKMAALYQRKNELNLRIFTTGKRIMEKRSIPRRKVDRITGMCFMEDEDLMAVTAIRKGQSDLYQLTIRNNRFDPITNDLYDDKDPRYVRSGTNSGILFLSNRNSRFLNDNASNKVFHSSFTLFLYQPSKGNILTPLSQTEGSLHDATQWGLEQYSYLEDENGKLSRRIVNIERNGQRPDTFSVTAASPTPFSILHQDYIHKSGKVFELSRAKKKLQAFLTPFDSIQKRDQRYLEHLKEADSAAAPAVTPAAPVVSEYYTPFDAEQDSSVLLDDIFSNTQKSKSKFQTFEATVLQRRSLPYSTTFSPDFIQTTLDNTLLFTRYQPRGSQFSNVNLSGFLTSTLTDVMEDYKITGGARLGLNFNSLDYFLQFANYRRRADWGLLYFHSTKTEETVAPLPYYSPYTVIGRRVLDYLQSNFTWPFNMLKSVRLNLGIRYDHTRYLAKEQYSIQIPNTRQFWLVSHAEYVYDNTINPMLNIWKGSRAKIFIEYQYRFSGETKGFTNVGYDARNYIPLYKNMILASRFAGAHSLGNAKVLYYLGGVDNPLFPQFDTRTMTNAGDDYAFQALATNLRGYKQGARNGQSYMVVNEEIRLPVYNTFFKRPVKSGFVRNLQLVAFADAGIAFKGVFPDGDNIVNQIRIRDDQSNVSVIIERSMGIGYGLGLRSRFLGYFVRSDFAWNIEGSKRPMLHLSLATDF